jgi:hypothetical protein
MVFDAILYVDKAKKPNKPNGGKNGYSLNQPGRRMGMENSNGE